jgi:phosphoenolpyruvate synthase/pyruvate phosphate dikinase
MESGTREKYLDHLLKLTQENMGWLEKQFGYTPLVSVRSGAPVSMPGMMDTILNVGLTTSNLAEWEARIGLRAAADSMRRLIQMLGSTGFGVPMGSSISSSPKSRRRSVQLMTLTCSTRT